MERTQFKTDGTTCIGYWHWPSVHNGELPVIVLLHGFSTEWTFGTAETIADFTSAGYAVFTFDYRYYGESSGEPRHLLFINRQLEDISNALAHVRQDERIDSSRLAVWGSSMGGGHALSTAAVDHEIAAVAAQVPHCSTLAALPNIPLSAIIRTTAHAFWDSFIGLFGKVHSIPVFADPGEVGGMSLPGWKDEGLRLATPNSEWVNELPARSMLSIINYRAGKNVGSIQCPVCIHYGLQDPGVPPSSVEKTAKRIANVEMHSFEGDHFDVYHGECRSETTRDQLEFFERVLNRQDS